MGLGLANFAGSAFNAYSTTGSFSRSAVNYDSGKQTTRRLVASFGCNFTRSLQR